MTKRWILAALAGGILWSAVQLGLDPTLGLWSGQAGESGSVHVPASMVQLAPWAALALPAALALILRAAPARKPKSRKRPLSARLGKS